MGASWATKMGAPIAANHCCNLRAQSLVGDGVLVHNLVGRGNNSRLHRCLTKDAVGHFLQGGKSSSFGLNDDQPILGWLTQLNNCSSAMQLCRFSMDQIVIHWNKGVLDLPVELPLGVVTP